MRALHTRREFTIGVDTRTGPSPDDGAGQEAIPDLARGRARLAGYKELLVENRNYRLWFVSSLGSSLGDWIGLFALQVLVVSLAEPGSRLALFGLGGIMMARLLPSLVFGPIAGVVADRYDRKRLMIVADVTRGALFLVVAFSRNLVTLLTLTFLIECLSLLYIAAKDASLPVIVERRHLTQANQMNLFVVYGPLPFGALTATLLVSMAGFLAAVGLTEVSPITFALLFNGVTFFFAAAVIIGLRLPAHGRKLDGETPGVFEELREGLRFIRDLPLIRALITGVVGVFFGFGVLVALGPELVRADLGRPESDWFGLVAAAGTGLLLGIVLVPVVTNRIRKERIFAPFLAGAAAMAMVTALLPSYRATTIFGFFLGGLAGMSFVSGYTLLHENTRDDMRARTFAAFYTSTRVSMFAALAFGPLLAGLIGRFSLGAGGREVTLSGVRITILIGGVVALLSAVSAWRVMNTALRAETVAGQQTIRLPESLRDPAIGGTFVAFEGGEGSGKSTQLRTLATALEAEGHDVVVTREPGGPPVSERIRELLLDPGGSMDARTETLLYAAARAEHVQRVIRPALSAGKTVLCDRFLDSSVVYQGGARGVGEDVVHQINAWAVDGITPDVVVLLDLDAKEGLRRAGARARSSGGEHAGGDRIEREDTDFHARVVDGFRALAGRRPDRVVVVDARGDPEAVAERVREALRRWLP